MELLQVLNKNIPQKKKAFDRFQKKGMQDFSKFLLQMIKDMKKKCKDTELLNEFFIELYDSIYQDIVFDKIKIAKRVVRLLETLALPIEYVGKKKWYETLKRLGKVKL